VIYARIAPSDVEVCIASDTALVDAPGVDERFEEWDALSPAELCEMFAERALEVARQRMKASAV
jgi:hypothetical protein